MCAEEQAAFFPDATATAVALRLRNFTDTQFVQRLWARDAGLWKSDTAHQAVIRARLGWLDVIGPMQQALTSIDTFVQEVRRDGLTHAVLLGMGGSSLAPEVFARTFGAAPGFLSLTVLDNTAPAAVAAVEQRLDPARTLFIVASKSGTTTEVAAFYHYFAQRMRAARGEGAGRHFIAITDADTPLEKLARAADFRRVFTNPADIGGRYSALSYFGLVPAALLGVDLSRLLQHAQTMASRCGADIPAQDNPGLRLGAALGELALGGRDKLTLVLAPEIASFGAWVEQLVAESTGKEGRGIVPIDAEPLGAAEVYRDDRVFVGMTGADAGAALDALVQRGHPALRWRADDPYALGGEFFRWEFATAVAGAILGVDPFDEPNVTESKDTTKQLLDQYQRARHFDTAAPLSVGGNLKIFGDPTLLGDPAAPADALRALFARIGAGDYLALLAYLTPSAARDTALARLRLQLRDRLRVATTLGYGPRFLHSTGQLHKGGGNQGVFLTITADHPDDIAVPGQAYSFGVLNRAQALGDVMVLQRRGRRVVRVHIDGDIDRGLTELAAAVDNATR